MTATNSAGQIERSSDRRHREIREAAIGAFLARGYEGTTMEEIAVRAGVSKQTVYKHFTDKQHLFADIVLSTTDDMSALIGIIAERLPTTTDLSGDLQHLAETFLVALMQPTRAAAPPFGDFFRGSLPRDFERLVREGFRTSPRRTREQFPGPRGSPVARRRRRRRRRLSTSSACCSGFRSTRPCSPVTTTTQRRTISFLWPGRRQRRS